MNITIAGTATNRKYTREQIDSLTIELAASDAEIGQTALPIPDPAGTDAVPAGRNVLVIDGYVAGTPPTYTTFLDGFVHGRGRERGPAIAPPNRLATLNVQDANALLYGMRVLNWKRPSETDVARVTAAAAAHWPTLDTTWVLSTNPITLPAKTYDTDTFVTEFVSDLVTATGKTMFVRSAGGVRYLHYHALTEGPSAAFSIDSTAGVADYSTIFPFVEPTIDSDALDLAYRITGRGANKLSVTVADATSEAAHGVDGREFEAVMDFPDATTSGALTALTNRALTDHKNERETIMVKGVGPLTAAQAEGIGPGFLIETTSDVLGLTAAVKRIAHLVWHYQHPGVWFADLELGMPLGPARPRKPGSTPPPDPITPILPCGAWLTPGSTGLDEWEVLLDQETGDTGEATTGYISAVVARADYSASAVAHFNMSRDSSGYAVFAKAGTCEVSFDLNVGAEDDTYNSQGAYIELRLLPSGTGSIVAEAHVNDPYPHNWAGTRHVRVNNTAYATTDIPWNLQVHVEENGSDLDWAVYVDRNTVAVASGTIIGASLPIVTVGLRVYASDELAAATVSASAVLAFLTFWPDDLSIPDWCLDTTGAEVTRRYVAMGDGSAVDFTLATGYLSGSLEVFVDSLAQTVIELDPAAGTFRLTFAPLASETIEAAWRRA